MKRILFISLLVFILIGCGSNSTETYNTPPLKKEDVVLEDANDGLGIPHVFYQGEPYTGVLENFQGYHVAEYLKDSVNFTTGYSYYSDGSLDSVIVPILNEKRYFNGDNLIDSIYMKATMEDGTLQTRILYFKDELLTNIKVIEK